MMTPERAAELAAEYAEHSHAIDPHVKRMEQIKAEFKQAYRDHYGKHPAGNLVIAVSRNNKFDADTFQATYPPETNGHMYKQVPDGKAIPENLKKQFMVAGDPKVEVK